MLILADEPTGNLDSKTTGEIMKILSDLHEQGRTIVMITHDPEIAEFADRMVLVKDGVIEQNPR
jgi:putative ABC transport system ATP-binding protein